MNALDLYMAGAEDDEYLMGARRRPGFARRRPTAARSVRKRLLQGARAAGATKPGIGNYAFAFPIASFTAAAPGPFTRNATPQKPLKPLRLLIIVTRSPATVGGLVTFQPFIGTTLTTATTDPLPVEAYSPDASNGRDNIAWPEVSQGTVCSFLYALSVAPGVGEQVDVVAQLSGPVAS